MQRQWYFFKVGQAGSNFRSRPKNMDFVDARLPLPECTTRKVRSGGVLNIPPVVGLLAFKPSSL